MSDIRRLPNKDGRPSQYRSMPFNWCEDYVITWGKYTEYWVKSHKQYLKSVPLNRCKSVHVRACVSDEHQGRLIPGSQNPWVKDCWTAGSPHGLQASSYSEGYRSPCRADVLWRWSDLAVTTLTQGHCICTGTTSRKCFLLWYTHDITYGILLSKKHLTWI